MAKNDAEKAYSILKKKQISNNYVKYIQYKVLNGGYILSDFDVQYIIENYNFKKYSVEKTVDITTELGNKLKDKYQLDFLPKKIRIYDVIGEFGNCLHCYIQYRQSVRPTLAFVNKNCILNPLKTVSIDDIVVDFDYYDNIAKDNRKLKSLQKEGIKFLLANKKCILADTMGFGKEQSVNTIIPTPNGNKKMGDLSVNDVVFGSDGKKHKILGVFQQGIKNIYEIEFSDGSKTNCGLDHLWIVKDKNASQKNRDWDVLTLKQIIERGIEYDKIEGTKSNRKHNYKFRIPICKAVEYNEKKHFISPYLLGVVIGNGSLSNTHFCFTIAKTDNEIKEKISQLIDIDYKIIKSEKNCCHQFYVLKNTSQNNYHNAYISEIKNLGLNVKTANKFIPNEYKIDSIENRIELLRGLMDTDGTISKIKNRIRYSTKSIKLANDVKELVESLGGIASVHAYDRTKDGKGIEYSVFIKIEICPFSLKRKADRYTIKPNQKKYLVKSIKSIKLIGQDFAVCLKVDSYDSSYLTNDYIVTHNTTQATIASMESKSNKILIITTASLKTNWKREIMLYNDESDIQILQGSQDKILDDKKYVITNYDILASYYEVPTEAAYETQILTNGRGQQEILRVPILVKNSKGESVIKQKKSTKKSVIEKCLKKSPLFLNNFDCVIIDEAQKLSNNKSTRYKVIDDFLKRAKPNYVFLLSGTPLTNKPINLFYILKLIDAPISKDYFYYVNRYCDAKTFKLKTGKEITVANGASNLDELREKIKHLYIRRLLTEMNDMVDKNIIVKTYDLSKEQMATYEKLWSEYVEAQQECGNDDSEQYRQLVEGMLVRQFLAKEMTQHTIDLVDNMLEEDGKIIIACTFTEELNLLKKHFKEKCVIYDGKMSTKQKDKAEQEFNNNPNIKIFIGNLIAAGVGLNLVAANKMIFNSFSWVAAENKQMEDRIYRLTQKKDVTCVYQLFNDSISLHMYNTVMNKQHMADKIIKSELNK